MKGIDINPKGYHKNPRQISEKQFANLKEWLEELGDLSGIIHDLNSNELIGGNQRSRVIFASGDYEVNLTKKYANPTKTGTVAVGHLTWNGEMYNYRQVRWTPKQCEKANIIANKAGGTWDTDILANEFEIEDLSDWGFEDWELSFANTEEEEEEQEEKKENGYVIKSEIIFDDEGQKANFDKFLIYLKKKYKQEETIAARLDKHIQEFI
ncbi:MAG: hypothetical protein MUC49_15620 [Raineya sp.]|jgi:hypothetical protein|nr:hypothetical protein [Raineya sp.]